MAERGWMTVSGAGPGIMEGAAKGAGREHTLGVNIDLPFEQDANPYVDTDTKLVGMKYFFTRKVALTRASRAFVIFPGGLGTMDEIFELLTLLHTGKTNPAPVVLVDTPDGTYWHQWMRFITDAVIADRYIGAADMCLVNVCHAVDDVVAAIEHFYSNYVGFDLADGRGRLVVRQMPTDEQLARLAEIVPEFASGAGLKLQDDGVVTFAFDGRNYVNLRLVINEANSWVA